MIMPKMTVSNYDEMLRKLSTANLILVAICIEILRSKIFVIDTFLKQIDPILPSKIPLIGDTSIPFGIFLPAFLITGLFEAIKLHDKISNFFGIRRRFDLRWILIPMALLSGARVSQAHFENVANARDHLMEKTFYKYASGSTGKAIIDNHTITRALTSWSWYWMCVESCMIMMITAFIFFCFENYFWAALCQMIIPIFFFIMWCFRADCEKCADSEIRQILDDANRKLQIASVYDAL